MIVPTVVESIPLLVTDPLESFIFYITSRFMYTKIELKNR